MNEDLVEDNLSIGVKLARLKKGGHLRMLDLFSGCGGMSLGFHRAKFDIVGGIEQNSAAAASHARNFYQQANSDVHKAHAKPIDITLCSPQEFSAQILNGVNPQFAVDVIAGGPPCQAFARIGRAKLRTIMEDPEAFLNDDRANLYINYLEYVEFFHPLVVLIENVPDIMNFGGQNVAEEIVASLDSLGYTSAYTILNAAHYGVPQFRQRFFLLAIHKLLNIRPSFPLPSHFIKQSAGYDAVHNIALKVVRKAQRVDHEQLSIDLQEGEGHHYIEPPLPHESLPAAITVKQALEDLPVLDPSMDKHRGKRRKFDTVALYDPLVTPSSYAKAMRTWPGFTSFEGVVDHVSRYLPRDFPIFAKMKPNDQYPEAHQIAMNELERVIQNQSILLGSSISPDSKLYMTLKKKIVPPYSVKKFPNKWWRLVPGKPSRTLTAHMGRDTYSHIHYSQSRVLSVREAARLQSFPDGFCFEGGMNAAFTQIGNAVPPLMAYALAQHISDLLSSTTVQSRSLLAYLVSTEYHVWLEQRRFLAWHLHCQKWRQVDIAAELKVSSAAISQWIATATRDGLEGIRSRVQYCEENPDQ